MTPCPAVHPRDGRPCTLADSRGAHGRLADDLAHIAGWLDRPLPKDTWRPTLVERARWALQDAR